MLFLILSILCSVSVGVIFKLTRRYKTDPAQIIAFNYLFALLLCYSTFQPNLQKVSVEVPWKIYAAIGVLLPVVFLFLIASIKHMGIVKTDAAQRLSLFIPILASWLLFKEDFTLFKITGLAIGFLALLLILSKRDESTKNKWVFPVIVFIGFGLIDILFKKIAVYTTLPYTTSLFIVFSIALMIMIFIVAYEIAFKKMVLNGENIFFGLLVGIFNFGNILFYLKAHQAFAENPSNVFAGMNMGVIILGSLVGIIAFKEKLSKLNYLGLLFALISIVFIVISQFYLK